MEDKLFDFEQQKNLLLHFRNLYNNIAKARGRKNTWIVPIIVGFLMGLASCFASICLLSVIFTLGKSSTSQIPPMIGPATLVIVWVAAVFLVYSFNKNRISKKIIEAERELAATTENSITKYPEWVGEIGGRESLSDLGKLNKLIDIYVSSGSRIADEITTGGSSGYHLWKVCVCKLCGQTRHDWHGCMCLRCKATRDEEHDWNGCKCKICNKTRDEGHDWDGCKCKICNKTRNQEHDWDHCICKRCRKTRNVEDEEHNWESKSIFSVTEDKYIEWYECSRCGVTKPD